MSEMKCDTCDGPHTTPCDRLKAESRRQHCSQISMKALTCSVLKYEDEIEQLEAVCKESNAICVCGCAAKDHEQYNDEGECCEHEDHECIRTSRPVAKIVFDLRVQVEELKGRIDIAIYRLTGAQGKGWPVETLLDAIRHGKH